MGPQDPLTSAPPASQAKGRTALSRQLGRMLAMQVVLFAGAALLFGPTTTSLMHAWSDSDRATYTHGYLIAAISFVLQLRNCWQLRAEETGGDLRACFPLALLSVLWLVALRAGVQAAHQFLLPIAMWLSIYAVLGRRVAFGATFALGYLYFAIPVWGRTGDLLQWVTVHAVDLMLQVSGIPAYVHGNIVQLAVGTFEIAGGCSGLHYFIVAAAVGTLYGEVHRDTLATRLRVIALALALAVLTNWVRVYLIILAGHLTDMQHYLVRVEHYRFGWVVFGVMMILFFLLVRRLPVAESSQPAHVRNEGMSGGLRPLSLALGLAGLAFGPLWNALAPVTPAALPAHNSILPPGSGVWSGPQQQANDDAWAPVFAGADLQQHGRYVHAGGAVDAYVAAYASQAQDKELIGYENSVLGPEDGQVLSTSRIEPHGPLTEVLLQDAAGQRSILWYFYSVGSLQTNREMIAQVWYGAASLVSIPLSRVVALRASCVPDCDSARASLQSLIDQADF